MPIPSHDSHPEFTQPVVYWNPVIAPGDLMFYSGKKAFPDWDGNALAAGLGSRSITRLAMDGKG